MVETGLEQLGKNLSPTDVIPEVRPIISVDGLAMAIQNYNNKHFLLDNKPRWNSVPYSLANPNCVKELVKRVFNLEALPSDRAITMAVRKAGFPRGHYWSTPFETYAILRKIDLSNVAPAEKSPTENNETPKVQRRNNGFIPDPKLLDLEGPPIKRAEAVKILDLGTRGLGQLCRYVLNFPSGELLTFGQFKQVENYLEWQKQQAVKAAEAPTRTEQVRLLGIGRATFSKTCERLGIPDFRSRLLTKEELQLVVASIRQH